MQNSDIPLPKDPRHQRFADLHALRGMQLADAYLAAGYRVTRPTARANGSRLMQRPDVIAYLAAVRQLAAAASVLEMAEKRAFLARIVRTPLLKIDAQDPDHKDGDLILKYKRTATETGETEEITKLDPLRAIDLDNKLSGDDPESGAMLSLAEALASLPTQTALPSGKM